EEIEPLKFGLYGMGYGAIIETDGDDEDLVERDLACAIQRVTNFRLKAAALSDGIRGKQREEEIRRIDGALDGPRPVLTGDQFANVHPRTEARCGEFIVEAERLGFIFLDMSQEEPRLLLRFKAQAVARVGVEDTQSFDFDGVAGFDGAGHGTADV